MSSPPGSPRICVTATSGLPDRGLGFCPSEDSAAKRDPATARSPDFFSRFLEHDPEKWVPVFPRDKREAFARRSCSNKKIERDHDSKKSHPALGRRGAGTIHAARIRPSCCKAVTPSSRPISSRILPSLSFNTVVPVNFILRPVLAGSDPTRKSLNAGPVWVPPPSHRPTT